jgi:hypothetical protein
MPKRDIGDGTTHGTDNGQHGMQRGQAAHMMSGAAHSMHDEWRGTVRKH